MNAHRSRSLGMAALIFILISLTAAVIHGAAPVRAEDVTTPDPIVIDGTTATVEVKLYKDNNRTEPLGDDAVTSVSTLYGTFSARFLIDKAPTPENYVAVYKFPDTIDVDNNDGGEFRDGPGADAEKAGTWKIEDNKVVFTFDRDWLQKNPANISVAANFSFQLKNKDVGSGGSASVVFPGVGTINIPTKDGKVTGEKSGVFSQGSDGTAKVTWTVKLTVESYATNVKFTDTLGDNFEFVKDSFKLDNKTIESQPKIEDQTATIENLGSLPQGVHTITYETKLKSGISASNREFISDQDASKNTAAWEWGVGDRPGDKIEGVAPSSFRYDMIQKTSKGTPSDITWTVKLNQGELKADMSGYKFTDKLDNKQTYTGSYTVYKGTSESDGTRIDGGVLDSSKDTFSYTFRNDLEDRYATYCIVYHTQMTDVNSYDTVHNNATIERDGFVSGSDDGEFTPQLTVSPITKRLVSDEDAATTGRATWETRVALKAIVNAVNPSTVTVKDTFQSAWSQNLGVDVDSITIKIGETVLVRGQNADWNLTANWPVGGTKRNFNLDIYVNDKVKAALENEDYAFITYTTTSDALSGWYSNFASVNVNGTQYYTSLAQYVLNKEATPSVDKPSAEASYVWNEKFDWKDVDGTDEKGAWIVDWTVYANRQGNKAGEYYGAGKLYGKPLNIVDTLPDGMSYVANSAKYTLVQNPYDLHAGFGRGSEATTVADGMTLAAEYVKSGGNTVAFSIPTTALGNYAGYAKLTYQTAVKRSELDTSKNEVKFTNSASAESGDKKFESGSGAVTIKNNVITKTGNQVENSNRIKYTILVNESAVALKSGTDFLELVDTMDAKCTLVPSTLKVYERVDDGWSALAEKNYSSKMEQISDGTGSRTKLTLSVPDEKYLKVEYEVIPDGAAGDEVPLSNTAELTGVKDGSATDDKSWIIQSAAASAGGNGYSITMTKYDAQQVGATLEGAKFTLYSVDTDQAKTPEDVESARTLFDTAATDASGKISFGTESNRMNNCKLYQLVESKAPEGYAVTGPTWIMLKGEATDVEYQSAVNKAKTVVKNAEIISDAKKDDIWIYDNRLTGSATIQAKKVLEGGAFKKGQFSFALKDAEGKVLQTATNDAGGNVSFNVEFNKTGTYIYTISEVVPKDAVNGVKDHITYDTAKHKVTVKVTNGETKLDTTVTYGDTESATPPTFTNKYSTTLPEAGGAGLTMTYLAGASMLCFAATWMHARRYRDLDRGGRRE